jgi:peptidoglycan/LPS O-acetylase OafA/YrhL
MRDRSFILFSAAGALMAEAAGVCVASVLSGIDTASGKSYQLGSGIALTVIGFATVVAFAVVAVGLAKARSWSWTPAMLIQLFALIVGIYLLQGHRYEWGVPAVALALGSAVVLLLPQSLDAFGRRSSPPPSTG